MKMGIKEFRERLGEVATGQEPVALTHHGRVVGHYLPIDRRRVADGDLDGWVAARDRFRAQWKSGNPDWQEQLSRFGLNDEGEPFSNDPRH